MDDFLSDLLELGSEKGGWRSGWAILGLVLGGAIGAYFGWISGGFVTAAGSGLTGAFFGWIGFVLFKGFLRFLVIFLICLAAVLAWSWATGKL